MKDKPYPISGHAAFFPTRDYAYWDDELIAVRILPTKQLAPKRVVKRANKKGRKK